MRLEPFQHVYIKANLCQLCGALVIASLLTSLASLRSFCNALISEKRAYTQGTENQISLNIEMNGVLFKEECYLMLTYAIKSKVYTHNISTLKSYQF